MFDNNTPTNDSHTFGGNWTVLKLAALEKYLKAFNSALSRQNFSRAYIDAFAGTGRVTLKGEDACVIPGSARRALQVEPGFHHHWFIETDAKKIAALNDLAGEFPTKSVHVIRQDANEALREICGRNHWRDLRAVLFLDPYGMHVEWSTLEAIAATQAIDVWYLFPYSALYRQAAKNTDGLDKGKEEAITRILGTDEWRSRFYSPPRQADFFGQQGGDEREGNHEALLEFVSERLRGLFPAVTPPKVLYQSGDSTKPKGAPLFALYFAAANPDPKAYGLATKIARDVLNAL
jgi:three-Cys-motif partner protein